MRIPSVALLALASCFAVGCESLDSGDLSGLLGGGELSNDTIVQGLKEALRQGTDRSVARLSQRGGYADDPLMRIVVPDELEKFASTLRKVGLGGEVDAFEDKMNEAAEHAVTQAGPVFVDAITSMTFDDARKILGGNKTAATSFFERKTKSRLHELYEPTVRTHMNEVGAVSSYNELRSAYDKVPFAPKIEFTLERYVTDRALDGLFEALGEVEKDIRTNPAARVNDLLRRVFADPR